MIEKLFTAAEANVEVLFHKTEKEGISNVNIYENGFTNKRIIEHGYSFEFGLMHT